MERILFKIFVALELVSCLHNEVYQVKNILRSTELFPYILCHGQDTKDILRLMKEDNKNKDKRSGKLKDSCFEKVSTIDKP